MDDLQTIKIKVTGWTAEMGPKCYDFMHKMYTATFRLLKVLKPKLQSHTDNSKLAESVSHASEPLAKAEINRDVKRKEKSQWYVSRMHIKRLPNSKMHVCSLFGYTELECFECVAFWSSLPFLSKYPHPQQITCTPQYKPCKTINIFSQPLEPPQTLPTQRPKITITFSMVC